MSLVEARFEAQKIAFGPLLFQAARLLRDLGILRALREARSGLGLDELTAKIDASRYGVLVLLEAGLAAGLVRSDGKRYFLTTTGACMLSDELTGVNMDVVQHCCFQAAYYLEDSIREQKPVGLQKIFGNWDTIYPALSKLPAAARDSWFKWDHYYSDAAFPEALPLVFERRPARLLDVGGNTGKWAIQCAGYSDKVAVTILDHPGQISAAQRNIEERGLQQRITCRGIDLLDHSQPFPDGFDAIWMSQFLVCFSEEDVVKLLQRAAAAMTPESRLYILDTFWDRQEHAASAYSLRAISLYFTFLANGVSRMYKASDITAMLEAAGLEVESTSAILGVCSSLLVCRKT
ncbi:MAG TPA: methyltransferase [Burkholderiales bacterium]|nr:methyltransferase [Burkholderiales bacterium]